MCGRPCIPMADYDEPTCARCDDAMEAVTVRALLATELRIITAKVGRAPRVLKPCGTRSTYIRHKRRGEPIDEACEQAFAEYNRQAARKRRARAHLALVSSRRRRAAS